MPINPPATGENLIGLIRMLQLKEINAEWKCQRNYPPISRVHTSIKEVNNYQITNNYATVECMCICQWALSANRILVPTLTLCGNKVCRNIVSEWQWKTSNVQQSVHIPIDMKKFQLCWNSPTESLRKSRALWPQALNRSTICEKVELGCDPRASNSSTAHLYTEKL